MILTPSQDGRPACQSVVVRMPGAVKPVSGSGAVGAGARGATVATSPSWARTWTNEAGNCW